jgi:hypothetical protein
MPFAHAQSEQTAGECSIKARSNAVVILVCPPLSNAENWRVAGSAACESKQFCNAWVWDDSGKAPNKAPATDADLPKNSSGAAVAIWVNDSKSLVTLKKVGAHK